MRAFISYRRDDSRLVAHLLAEYLRSRLGQGNVFLDTENVAPGEDIWPRISEEIRSSDFLIALIGPNWQPELLGSTSDWVYRELALASQIGCAIIPTTHSGVDPQSMLSSVPDSLEGVRGLNALAVRDPPDHLSSFSSGLKEFLNLAGLSLPSARRTLEGVRVGLSTSEPETSDGRSDIGLTRYTILYLAERLLDAGASLTYGGLPVPASADEDWNITNQLRVLARDFQGQIENYSLASYVGEGQQFVGGLRHVGHVSRLSVTGLSPIAARAIALYDLRLALAERTDARVCLGGKLGSYAGRMPGVVEEVSVAIAHNQPIFLLGGFGGATEEMAKIVDGSDPIELTLERQTYLGGDEYSRVISELDGTPYEIQYQQLTSMLSRGTGVLNNSLGIEGNELLMTSTKWRRTGDLIVEGLVKTLIGDA